MLAEFRERPFGPVGDGGHRRGVLVRLDGLPLGDVRALSVGACGVRAGLLVGGDRLGGLPPDLGGLVTGLCGGPPRRRL